MRSALIFDLDGTLADTAPDLVGATNAVLASCGLPAQDLNSLRAMAGFGARALINQAMTACGRSVAPDDMPPLVEIFLAHYRAHIADASTLFPGVLETLAGLKADGAKLAVLTNKAQELTDPLLPLLGLGGMFDAVYGVGRMPYHKPDPRIFADVVAACGATTGVMIGDTITDLKTARAAGAPCVLVGYGFTPVPATELGGDAVIDDFTQLPAALQALGW